MKRGCVIVITGPTASGKSALAVALAHRLNTEIVSADSRQIYKGIPIVTAVPSEDERDGIAHHLIEMLNLDEYYSASIFEQDSLSIIGRLLNEVGIAIVCGGSMMYVDALCNGIDEIPTVPDDIRNALTEEWIQKGDEWLLSMLKLNDPDWYGRVDLRNMKRVFHAVEVSLTAGVPYSSLLRGEKVERPFDIIKICLGRERSDLFSRINNRVDLMMQTGLLDEVRSVYHLKGLNSLNTVGIKELFSYFDGDMPLTVAVERIKKNTRVYAKKQITWYKRDDSIKWIDAGMPSQKSLEAILSLLK